MSKRVSLVFKPDFEHILDMVQRYHILSRLEALQQCCVGHVAGVEDLIFLVEPLYAELVFKLFVEKFPK